MSAPTLPGSLRPANPEHPITVLMIDDQLLLGEAVRRMLANERDIQFHFCQDVTKALETAAKVKPTVILVDLVMPGKDGLELVTELRGQTETREVPIIVLSTKEDPAIKVSAFKSGANDYVVKLPDALELIARIRSHSQAYIAGLERNQALRDLLESREQLAKSNAFIRQTFDRYVSSEVVETLLREPGALNLGGERRLVTILLSDLRGFTPIVERLPPEDTVRLINIYLEEMTEIIHAHKGTIVEFIGDAILAVFGAPVLMDDDARRAIGCAVEMQVSMTYVNEKMVSVGLPEVAMGIGLHTGEVVVGNVGSMKRMKYGVVGSTVNVASRIESYTVGGQVLISEETRGASRAELLIDGTIEAMPKGVNKKMTLYDVIGIGAPYDFQISRKDEPPATLASPLDVHITLFVAKRASGVAVHGRLVGASRTELRIETAIEASPLSEVKVVLEAREEDREPPELYGKVMKRREDGSMIVRITSATPAAVEVLAGLRRG